PGIGQIFFADAVRVDERVTSIHAAAERAQELRYCLTFGFCEELSRCDGIVGDECARYLQTDEGGQAELTLLVFGVALMVKVVNPAHLVKRVEKTFERGGRLVDAHRAITFVK